jgi:cytochrome P450
MYATNHSETNFTRPKEFIPERWLSDAPVGLTQNNRKIVKAVIYILPIIFGS